MKIGDARASTLDQNPDMQSAILPLSNLNSADLEGAFLDINQPPPDVLPAP